MHENVKIPVILISGVAATAYGMLRENNFVFIAGIVLVVAGYLLIRKNLKSKQRTTAASDEE